MSKLGLPVSHSGLKVMKLITKTRQVTGMRRNTSNHIPSVKLSGAKHNNPVMSGWVVAGKLLENVEAHGTSSKHCEKLERYNLCHNVYERRVNTVLGGRKNTYCRIRDTPACIGSRILFP